MAEMDLSELEDLQVKDLLVPELAELSALISEPSSQAAELCDESEETLAAAPPLSNDVTLANSARFFSQTMNKFSCKPKCSFPNMNEMVHSFALFSEIEKANAARAMIF
eukprot:IDg4547t1